MIVVPGDIPVTMPEVPIIATAGLPLLHVPPPVISLKEAVRPTQIGFGPPVIFAGVG